LDPPFLEKLFAAKAITMIQNTAGMPWDINVSKKYVSKGEVFVKPVIGTGVMKRVVGVDLYGAVKVVTIDCVETGWRIVDRGVLLQ
jgi:hypothetical protein